MTKDVAYWTSTIKSEQRVRDKYRKRCQDISDLYSDQSITNNSTWDNQTQESFNFNVVWSNIETLKAALYAKNPKPDVRRRYKDDNPLARDIAMVTERSLEYVEDTSTFEQNMKMVVQNYLIGWPGVARNRYEIFEKDGEPTQKQVYKTDGGFSDEEGNIVEDEPMFDGEVFTVETTESELLHEEVSIEVISGAHFGWEPAESWDKVGWCYIKHYIGEEDLKEQFGEDKVKDIPLGYRQGGDIRVKEGDKEKADTALIYEVFDKRDKKVCSYAEGMQTYLTQENDPYNLEGFWPFAEPLFPTVARTDGTPTPDFIYYQDQAAHLNTTVDRIAKLVKVLKYRGVYDAVLKEAPDIATLNDGDFIPINGLSDRMIAEGKIPRMEDFFYSMPLDEGMRLLNELRREAEFTKQQIYEITGISDIVRGATKASETLGAQQMKAQFANLRLTNKQKDVERFCRDTFRILAELISENFERDTLSAMTGMEVTEEMTNIMSSDFLREYNINVETDSTVLEDSQEEQRTRTEALTGMISALERLLPMTQMGMPIELLGKLILFGLQGMKGGRELESLVTDLIDQTQQEPQGMPQGAPQALPEGMPQIPQQALPIA